MFSQVFERISHGTKKGVQRQKLSKLFQTLPVTTSAKSIETTVDNQYDRLSQIITPLAKMPYLDQLQIKQSWVFSVLKKYEDVLTGQRKMLSRSPLFIKPRLHRICPSPVVEKYRNRELFVVKPGIDGNPKTVGFLIGKPRDGQAVCALSKDIITLRDSHYKVAKAFEDYIRSSPLPPCLKFDSGGFWRELQVRSNEAGNLMVTVVVSPRNYSNMMLQEEQEALRQYFVEGEGAECQLHSLYFQACPHSICSAEVAPYHLLHGEKYLKEELSGRTFFISPETFFQINTKMAEVLYDKVVSFASFTKQTTFLDLCCGTGTLSILASPFVRGSVGIDISKEAIKSAAYNAYQNGIDTATFVAGQVEKVTDKTLEELGASPNIVVVLNPGRAGVSNRIISKLRHIPQIRRVIYISCLADHQGVINNITGFLQPKANANGSEPFRMTDVIPVDMFPQTSHCEVVFVLQR